MDNGDSSIYHLQNNSGPLLDRIDIHIEVPSAEYKDLAGTSLGTSSESMRDQVAVARKIQRERFTHEPNLYNAKLKSKLIRQYCQLDHDGVELMRTSVNDLGLSARAHDKVLRVARTIADLDQSENIQLPHLQEAINYRMLDREIWT